MTPPVPHLKKVELSDLLFAKTGGVVLSGPFQGMKLLREECWHDGNLTSKLLGCYECELHDNIEKQIKRLSRKTAPVIVNIGCAEGYYAVGIKRRLPHARVEAIDIDVNALRITRDTAAINGVLVGEVTDPLSGDDVMAAADLVVCDCEGAELMYLDPGRFPSLLTAAIIAEMHNGEIMDSIFKRFDASHEIWSIRESWRNPHQYEELRGWCSHDKWMAISEGRPCTMYWLVMEPKTEVQ